MALASPRSTARAFNPVPRSFASEEDHRRLVAQAIDNINSRVEKYPVKVVSVTAAYTQDELDLMILGDATGGAFSVTLVSARGRAGRRAIVKKTDVSVNAVTIDGNGSETIDGATTIALSSQYSTREIVSDGTNWHVVSSI